jgi:hypothetical protein
MSTEQLKETLKKLHETINNTEQVDAELAELLSVLNQDIHQLLGKEPPEEDALSNLGERSLALSAKFAAQNPRLEMSLRELADILGRMGI